MSISISRPIREVFTFVANPENEPKLHPSIVNTEAITKGPIGLGSKWRQTFNGMGTKGDVVLEITEYEPNQRITFKGTEIGPVEPIFAVTFEEKKDKTKVTYTFEPKVKGGTPLLLLPLITRYGKRDLKKYLTKLKAALEPTDNGATRRP